LIRELRLLGCEVLIGAEGAQAALLQQEFPDAVVLPLPGYHISYSPAASGFGVKMVLQLPRMGKAVRLENRWLKKMVLLHRIDAVISDNRFGLHHPGIPCVIMTHQLRVRSPFGRRGQRALQKVNYYHIGKFDACWVVDFEGPANLAGALSHPEKMPRNAVRYIGGLSRFHYRDATETEPLYDLLALISGPEPQRTFFEDLLLEQLSVSDSKALIVTGQPVSVSDRMVTEKIRRVHHLDADALNEAILRSSMIVCRSGYSSVMDLIKLRKKAILVPTPGQTEQEYLGDYLMGKGYFPCFAQKDFNIRDALQQASVFPYGLPSSMPMDIYKPILNEFVQRL
jgi:hypothetical protein